MVVREYVRVLMVARESVSADGCFTVCENADGC